MTTQDTSKLWSISSKQVKFLEVALPLLNMDHKTHKVFYEAMDVIRSKMRTMDMFISRGTEKKFAIAYINCYLEIDKAYKLMISLMPATFKKDIEQRIAVHNEKSKWVKIY